MITLWRPCALQCLIPMGGGHFQNTMHLRSYVWLLDLHSTSANQSKRFSYVKSTPCILKWGCRSSQLLQFAGFSIMICRHLAHCKYLAGPSTLVFLAGCKPPHFCCFFSYCSEQLAYIVHVPNKLKIILLSGIMTEGFDASSELVWPLDLHIMAGVEALKIILLSGIMTEGFDASSELVWPLDLHIMAGLEAQAFLSYTESADNCVTTVIIAFLSPPTTMKSRTL
jgi:hypothetical protein